MSGALTLDQAAHATRTGDIWIFRGRSGADRAIRAITNAPVNHVGMTLVVDDLPPLMWHAELGQGLQDVWTGSHHRGVQLHDLRAAVAVWSARYGQRAWLRQLEPVATTEQTDAALRMVARLDGTPFPSVARLAGRWTASRLPRRRPDRRLDLESAYCAQVVTMTLTAMGLLPAGRDAAWYDPGRFWSGDDLELVGAALGGEIEVACSAQQRRPHLRPERRAVTGRRWYRKLRPRG